MAARDTHGQVGPVKVVDQPPSSVGLMVRAALPAIPGVAALPGVRRTARDLPDLELVRRAVPVDTGHVASYASVCGFPAKDDLPLTYLHMLAFPLHMQLMTDPAFPFPAMGTVHLENTITRHRRTTARDRYDVSVRAANLRGHAKGRAFDLLTEVRVDDALVWEEVSTYLRRGKGDPHARPGAGIPLVEDGGVEWRLGGDLGRRYAAVSGDRNPIHLYGVTAKAFGFPRQIAHGMWSMARCVAAVENRLPDAVRVEVAFKTPILLPGTVRFATRRGEDGTIGLGLSNARNGAPHLAGRASRA
ncbi:MaoC family dehydratase [Nocardioides caldifontis]|uniref:MaoC family dehydratase n=1 Tax=Nocardioides caldifontis TaxID=2588938 RepID=UPI001EEF82B3|nr:MaoC/PaaZ C-terminal domain-containing protein [Nocardioides caldifontis]